MLFSKKTCFTVLAVCISSASADAQFDYKEPKKNDYTQALTLANAVMALAAPQASPSPSLPQPSVSTALASSVASMAPVTARTFAQTLAFSPDLNQAVADITAEQVSPARQGNDPARFRIVNKLVTSLCQANPPLCLNSIQAIYNNADQVSTQAQLNENEKLGYIIHSALVRAGQVNQYDYRRSVAYKRIVRRRLYLLAPPVIAQP